MKSLDLYKPLKENATGGTTGTSSVAVSMGTLGEKGGFTKQDVQKRLQGYTNALTTGGVVKVKEENNGQ